MKDTIYTIPLTDAFHAEDECPFCFIHKKLEQDAIAFTLGASYMEDDIREVTDRTGFCPTHFKKLYDYGNRLGLALILHTHYKEVTNELNQALSQTSLPSPSLFQKLTKNKSFENGNTPINQSIDTLTHSCYICERVENDMMRYAETFFYLLNTSPEFETLFKNSKGFCLPHFNLLIKLAPNYLKDIAKNNFFEISRALLTSNLKRIEDELEWFIDKYDYRNTDAPWKNSKDAIPRGIQKLAGIYPQDEPFTQK